MLCFLARLLISRGCKDELPTQERSGCVVHVTACGERWRNRPRTAMRHAWRKLRATLKFGAPFTVAASSARNACCCGFEAVCMRFVPSICNAIEVICQA
jgi:hypothetical protein